MSILARLVCWQNVRVPPHHRISRTIDCPRRLLFTECILRFFLVDKDIPVDYFVPLPMRTSPSFELESRRDYGLEVGALTGGVGSLEPVFGNV